MVSKCSVFGHAYGDETTEEITDETDAQRLEQVRTVRTCDRCGETEVQSEHTTVQSVPETPADTDDQPTAVADGGTTPSVDPEDDAVLIESESSDEPTDDGDVEADVTEDDVDDDGESTGVPDDDAIIMESTSTSDEASDTNPAEGFTHESESVFLDTDENTESMEAGETLANLTPAESDEGVVILQSESTDSNGSDTDEFNAETADGEGSSVEPQPAETPDSPSQLETQYSRDTELQAATRSAPALHCDTCSVTLRRDQTPLRAGDSCPACTGWLTSE